MLIDKNANLTMLVSIWLNDSGFANSISFFSKKKKKNRLANPIYIIKYTKQN